MENNNNSNNLLSLQQLGILIRSLRITLTNIRMYPITSNLVEQPMNEFVSSLKRLLSTQPYVAISEMDEKIFVNSQEYNPDEPTLKSHSRFLAQFFVQSGLKSVTFKPETKEEDIKNVLIALVSKKPKTTTKEIVKQVLQEKNISSIIIDEVEFITILPSDKDVKNILKNISSSVNSLPDLMNVLGKAYTDLDNIKDDKSKNTVKDSLAKYVSSLDPSVIRDLFSQPLPPKIEESGLKQSVFNNLTKQKVEEIFNEIILWVKNLKKDVSNEIEYLDRLNNLKDFIKLAVNSPVSRLVPIEIFEELFKVGMIDVLPEWIKNRDEKKSWITELDELLNSGESVKLLQESFITSLNENIEKLCSIGLDNTIDKLVEKMSDNLQNPVIKLRQLSASSLNTITKQLTKYNKTKIATKIVSNLINLMLKEKDESILKQYFEIIKDSMLNMVINKNYVNFCTYGKQLLKYALDISNSNPQKAELIYELFDKIYILSKDILAQDILILEGEQQDSIFWFLNFLSDTSNEILVNTILKTENVNLKRMILELLKQKKDVSVKNISKILSPKTNAKELSRVIEILEEFDYDFTKELSEIFFTTTYSNKISIINYFYNKPSQENISLLIKLLDYEETQVSDYLVDIISSLELKIAVPKLINLLKKTKNLELKKRICVALGILKEIISIDILKKIVFSKDKLFGLIKGLPVDLRVVACWALGNFITLPEIKDLFLKLKNSPEEQIALTAKKILNQ